MRKSLLGLFLIALVAVSLVLVSHAPVSMGQASASSITINADKYLVNAYNSTLKLIPETNNNVYWITSDNLLAYFALQNDSSDISSSIKNTIMTYATTYGLPKDSNGLPIDYKHEVVIGDVLTQQFGTSNIYYLANGSDYTIKAEVNNGSTMSDWQNYSDLVAYKGLSYYNQGDTQDATNEYNLMLKMWNGHGFNDSAYNHTTGIYDTYKLALAYLLAKDCGIQPDDKMCNIIASMQDSNGGIHTQYTFNGNLTIVGSVNTETTALVAIANPTNTSTTQNPAPTPEFPIFAGISIFMAIMLVGSILLVVRKRKIYKRK